MWPLYRSFLCFDGPYVPPTWEPPSEVLVSPFPALLRPETPCARPVTVNVFRPRIRDAVG